MKLFCLLALFLVLSTSAQGEIYSWRDRTGTSHFVNSMDDVPAKYRSRVKSLQYGPDKGESSTSPTTLPGSAPSPEPITRPQPTRIDAGATGIPHPAVKREVRRVRESRDE